MTQVAPGPVRQKLSPMVRSRKHREEVAHHLCIICFDGLLQRSDGIEPVTQACHVNYLGAKHGRPRGMQDKVDDFFTVPMCKGHHDSQTEDGHSGRNEIAWWEGYGLDPEDFCRELAENSPDPKIQIAAKEIFENDQAND